MNRFLCNQCGATAIEYGVICAVIILVFLAGLQLLGNGSTGIISRVSDKTTEYMR